MRFKEAMDEERRKAAPPEKPKKADQELLDLKREINVNNKVKKLLGTGRSAN